jgi:hypothetical protein
MPKKDPVTGVEVMTLPEFLAAEGEREGKSGAEVMEEIRADIASEESQEEERLRDPVVAFKKFWLLCKDQRSQWQYDRIHDEAMRREFAKAKREIPSYLNTPLIKPPMIKKIIQVYNVTVNYGFRGSGMRMCARFLCTDGVERMFVYGTSESFATMTNPPDYDEDLSWYTREEWEKKPKCCETPNIETHEGKLYCKSCDQDVW